jgi:ankyrin repeat protein
MLDFNKVPRYEAQPFHFKQETLRTNLAQSDDDIAVFKAAISGSDDYLNVLFEAGENIRSLVRKRSDFIDLVLHYAWQSLDWDDDISLIAVCIDIGRCARAQNTTMAKAISQNFG